MHKRIWLVVVLIAVPSLSGERAMGAGGTRVGGDAVDAIIGKNTLNYFASGALGTVRSNPDDTTSNDREKSIGCWVDSIAGDPMVQCEAITDITNTAGPNGTTLPSLRCISHDPAMVAAVGAMNSDSMITFQTPTASSAGVGTCTHIKVENFSSYEVKTR